MKKVFLLLVVASLLSISISSCTPDDSVEAAQAEKENYEKDLQLIDPEKVKPPTGG